MMLFVIVLATGAVGFGIGRIYERLEMMQKRAERQKRRARHLKQVQRKADFLATVSCKAPGEAR
jgi:predicted amino acid dehydrogenase